MKTLLAVDLAHEPERIVDEAVAWSARFGGELDLAYVDPYAAVGVAAQIRALGDGYREALNALLDRVPEPMRGRVHVWEGPVAAEISARSSTFDLLIMGTHGRSGVQHLVLGSVAERVVRASRTPVLVMRGPPPGDRPRVLIALDTESTDGTVAFEQALRTLMRLDGRVDVGTVESVLAATPLSAEAAFQPVLADFLAARRAAAEGALGQAMARLPVGQRGRTWFDVGAPGREIARRSAEYDLVVVGTHGRSGLQRWWLGSVAERVVRTAQHSVLVVPIGL